MSGTSWANGDAIGVSDGNVDDNTNTNIKYITDASGNFSSSTNIYVLGSNEVTYTAYYPYSGEEKSLPEKIDFSVVDNNGKYTSEPEKIDFLWAEAKATRAENAEDVPVTFQFSHKMSQLAMTFTGDAASTRVAEGTEVTYTLKNVPTGGSFNPATGEITPSATKGNIVVTTTIGQTSSVILPPAAVAEEGGTTTPESIEVQIEVGGDVYVGTIAPSMDASNQYSYDIDLKETPQGLMLTISSATIQGWTDNDSGSIDITKQEAPNTLEVGDFVLADGTVIDKNADLAGKTVRGVVFYVGDATTSDAALKAEHAGCVNGLAVALNNANSEVSKFASSNKEGAFNWFKNETGLSAYVTTESTGTNSPTAAKGFAIQGYNNTQLFIMCAAETETNAVEEVKDESGTVTTEKVTWDQISNYLISNLDSYKSAVSAPEGTSGWYLPSWKELDIIRENYDAVSASVTSAGGAIAKFEGYDNSENKNLYWSSTERNKGAVWEHPLVSVAEGTNGFQQRSSSIGHFRFVFAF